MKLVKILILLATSLGSHVVIAKESPISVVTEAEKEELYVDANGAEKARLVPVATVIPGDKVVYTITFSNSGEQTANNITIVDPIPAEMRYLDGTAMGPGTEITFSANNGQSYASADKVFVTDDDGARRVATAAEYTHIRWVLRNPMEPSTQAFARFKAELR